MGVNDYQDNVNKYKSATKKYNELSNTDDKSTQLEELSLIMTKEYTLMIIWLIIAIIIIVFTSITLIYNTEINTAVWVISILFILYCTFFIFKNIYHL